jgi:hypothetical protein
MSVNKDLLRETLAYIEVHPEEWDQRQWICGTSACFAGRACLLSGAQPCDWGGKVVQPNDEEETGLVVAQDSDSTRAIGVGEMARRLLGLTDDQADRLFHLDNDLEDLRYLVGKLTR